MDERIAEFDLTVEYRQPRGASAKLWCVLKAGRTVLVNDRVDPAIWMARHLALGDRCDAWLLVDGCDPIRITAQSSASTALPLS